MELEVNALAPKSTGSLVDYLLLKANEVDSNVQQGFMSQERGTTGCPIELLLSHRYT
jgi:hypothetical protein